jgi:hypothetical protein
LNKISVAYNFANQIKIQRLKSALASSQKGLDERDYFSVKNIIDEQPYYYEGFPEAAIIQFHFNDILHRICADYAIWDAKTLNNTDVLGASLVIQSDTINPSWFFGNFPPDSFIIVDYESNWPVNIIFRPDKVTGDPLKVKLARLICWCPFLIFADSSYDVPPWLPPPSPLGTTNPAYADVTGGVYMAVPQEDGSTLFARQLPIQSILWNWNDNQCNGFDYSFYQF